MSEKMIVGIDLGTTNTCVYYKTRKEYSVVENFEGKRTTPSFVTFTEDGDVIVGEEAKKQMLICPERTIYGAKRLIGHKRGDKSVEELFGKAGFKINFDENDFPYIEIPGDDKKRKPEEISAIILHEAKRFVKNKTGREIDECVITVPAYFNDLQRRSTKIAAELAGINCIKLVNEPTAAAIAFQEKIQYENGNILVYDFGGGTLDVSILNVVDNKYTVLAVSGDTSLGGEDIDSILVEEMIKRFKKNNPDTDPEKSKKAMARLKESCKEAKHQLSNCFETLIVIYNFIDNKDLIEKITRTQFEYLCNDIIDKLTDPITKALEDAGLKEEEINHIILVGGSSAIPFVKEAITDYFDDKIEPLKAVDPNESVALGAVIVCDRISNNIIIETQPISIGIKYGNKLFKKYIMRNQRLPQTGTFQFTTTKKNQRFADIEIYQGEEDRINMAENTHILLGKYRISDLPPREQGDIIITIKLSVDEGGILSLEAYCNETGVAQISKSIKTKEILDDEEKRAVFERIKALNK